MQNIVVQNCAYIRSVGGTHLYCRKRAVTERGGLLFLLRLL